MSRSHKWTVRSYVLQEVRLSEERNKRVQRNALIVLMLEKGHCLYRNQDKKKFRVDLIAERGVFLSDVDTGESIGCTAWPDFLYCYDWHIVTLVKLPSQTKGIL